MARSNLESAELYFRKSAALAEESNSIYRAFALSGLGTLAWRKGNLDEAGKDLTKAIGILIVEAPTSDRTVLAYDQLSNVERDRGNLALAEEYLLKALTLLREHDHKELAGGILNDEAFVALYRGEVEKSKHLFLSARNLQEKYEPGSTDFANTLMGLGMALAAQGEFGAAEGNLKESLDIQRKLAPTTFDIPRSLTSLGDIARKRGDQKTSEAFYQQAIAALKIKAPESVYMVQALSRLAKVTALRGASNEAESNFISRRLRSSKSSRLKAHRLQKFLNLSQI